MILPWGTSTQLKIQHSKLKTPKTSRTVCLKEEKGQGGKRRENATGRISVFSRGLFLNPEGNLCKTL
jgi:hypothetical protein